MIIGAEMRVQGHMAMPKSKLIPMQQTAFRCGLIEWWAHMLPDHFKENAKRRYRHEKRTEKYNRNKLNRTGHNIDLVFSGRSRDMATERIDIHPTKKYTTGHVRVAKAFNFSNRFDMPDMKKELSTILKGEQRVLLRVVKEQMTEEIARDQSLKVIKI